jgi:hypothetical protein
MDFRPGTYSLPYEVASTDDHNRILIEIAVVALADTPAAVEHTPQALLRRPHDFVEIPLEIPGMIPERATGSGAVSPSRIGQSRSKNAIIHTSVRINGGIPRKTVKTAWFAGKSSNWANCAYEAFAMDRSAYAF